MEKSDETILRREASSKIFLEDLIVENCYTIEILF
jgi:hypothetical protein